MKSGLQLLSTSVLPFPSFLLSLSLSVVITVKVQLRCLRWELSQRCVTMMWCFTRLVTKLPAVIHTCGTSDSFSNTHAHTNYHMHLSSTTAPVDTLSLPLVHFYLTRHYTNQVSCFPGTVLTGSMEKRNSFTATLDHVYLFILSENFAVYLWLVGKLANRLL